MYNYNWIQVVQSKGIRWAAGRCFRIFAGALLCFILTACRDSNQAMDIAIGSPLDMEQPVEQVQDASVETTVLEVYVHVCGAVQSPGVVVLPAGSRCKDALEAAGGLCDGAAGDAVNLAEPVTDGMQLYFPTLQEYEAGVEAEANARDGLVDINRANVEQLCTLPGIGEAKARAIVTYRQEHGAFGEKEEIMQVPGIKESAYSQMKDFIKVK